MVLTVTFSDGLRSKCLQRSGNLIFRQILGDKKKYEGTSKWLTYSLTSFIFILIFHPNIIYLAVKKYFEELISR
jgi:hypothetical protein